MRFYLFLILWMCLSAVASGQKIEGVHFTDPRFGSIYVLYDLVTKGNETYFVRLYYRIGKGNWQECTSVEGNVGAGVGGGENLSVYWTVWDDLPEGLEGDLSFRVEGQKEKNDIEEMVFVEGGEFLMGCTDEQGGDCDDDEKPVRKVFVNDFYMGKYEVTFEQYDAFCEATGRDKANDDEGRGTRPVINVSWYDAIEYCNWLSEQEGLEPCYRIDKENKDPNNKSSLDDMKWTVECDFTKNGYRLPTEAEWEYAARGGRASEGHKGAGVSRVEELFLYGNYCDENCTWSWRDSLRNDGYQYTAPVGSFRPNELGLYDMSGNVWEWCWDWYGNPYISEKGVSIYRDAVGSIYGANRVLRGGSWNFNAAYLRVADRSSYWPFNRDNYVGFRLTRTP